MAGLNAATKAAANPPENGSVSTQVAKILPKRDHLTSFGPKAESPTATTPPTWQCVVDTGMLMVVAMMTVKVEANSTHQPRWKLMSTMLVPMVLITR